MELLQDLAVIYLPPQALTPYEGNARKHAADDIAQIKESIRLDGFNDPIGIWGDKNIIVEGHGRQIAAMELGMEKVPCIRLDHLTDTQRRDYAIRHNRTAELSGWDFDKLQAEISALELEGVDLGGLDFDLSAFSGEAEESAIVEDDPPEPPENPVSKPGDIWQLGHHRLMCGDSTSLDDVLALLDGQQADALVTDPPYNVDYHGGTKEKLKIINDKQADADYRRFPTDAFTAADHALKPGAAFYIWHADSEGYNCRGVCRDVGWAVRQCLIWNKNSLVMGRQDYQWKHEPCLYGWKDGAKHVWNSDRKQTTVLDFDRPQRNDIHPTMKPVALIDYLIQNSTKPGAIVLDLFNGSGTTVIACEQDGRTAYAMELDPHYVDVAVTRWENLTGQKAVLLNGGPEDPGLAA